MAGRAVITTRASSATMKKAAEVSTSAQPREGSGRESCRAWRRPAGQVSPMSVLRGPRGGTCGALATARLTRPTEERARNRQLSRIFLGGFCHGPVRGPAFQFVAERAVAGGLDGPGPGRGGRLRVAHPVEQDRK